jgi:hypothetical protein
MAFTFVQNKFFTPNAGIKSLRATLPDEILMGILLLEP